MRVPLRVLLVEDSTTDAELVERVLRMGGYEPTCERVESAPAFRAALDRGGWDVVLSDHHMPRFSSLDALAILVERGLDIPFLIVSGTIGEESAVAAMRAGVRDYVLKSNLTRLPAAIARELHEAGERSAAQEAGRKRHEAEQKYRLLVEQIPAITYTAVMREGLLSINYVSPQVRAITGRPPDDLLQATAAAWLQNVHPEDRGRVLAEMDRTARSREPYFVEYRVVAPAGRIVWLRDEARWWNDGQTEFMQGCAVDITDRKRAEETIQHLASYDAVTGLPNRVLLGTRLEAALESARRHHRPLALLRLGLDRFREINSTLGRDNGDLLLRQVGARLVAIDGAGLVSRLGAAEFSLLLLPGTDAGEAQRVAEEAIRALQQPIVIQGLPVEVGASVGIAMYPDHGETSDTLLRHADVALDCARQSLGRAALYSKEQDPYDPRRLALMGELRSAIERNELRLEYQPKIALATGRMVGVEALVRWRHPDLGEVPPGEFVPIAEQSALIRPLTRWVLDRAFRQCREWRDAGMQLSVFANLSARNLTDPDLAGQVDELLETWGVAPQWVGLELTESGIMTDPRRAATILASLSQRGVSLSIDDFGTGYSSLAYLRQLPVSEVKIDRSFVRSLAVSHGDLSIVRTIIDLGHHLGLQVVAEGVENARTWDLLADAGCDLAQGYHMARPMSAQQLDGWVRNSSYGTGVIAKRESGGDG